MIFRFALPSWLAHPRVRGAKKLAARRSYQPGVEALEARDCPSTVTIPNLYNTGVDAQGQLLAAGNPDPHYALISAPAPDQPGAALAVIPNGFPFNGYWLPNGTTSEWIAPHADENDFNGGVTEPAGDYIYETKFDLTGLKPATASITGQITADNTVVHVILNGVDVGNASNKAEQYRGFTPLNITSGFVAGVNKLDFVVTNRPQTAWPNNEHNPSGFRAELSGTAEPGKPVALDQDVTLPEHTAAAITLGAVAPGGGPLTYTIVRGPKHGTVKLAGDVATYQAGDEGTDSFTFRVSDTAGRSNVATVHLTATDTPLVAHDLQYTLTEDQTLKEDAAHGLVAGNPQANGETVVVADPGKYATQHGTISVLSNGAFTYQPNKGYVGADFFPFKIRESHGNTVSSSALVMLQVEANEFTVKGPEVVPGFSQYQYTAAGLQDKDKIKWKLVSPNNEAAFVGADDKSTVSLSFKNEPVVVQLSYTITRDGKDLESKKLEVVVVKVEIPSTVFPLKGLAGAGDRTLTSGQNGVFQVQNPNAAAPWEHQPGSDYQWFVDNNQRKPAGGEPFIKISTVKPDEDAPPAFVVSVQVVLTAPKGHEDAITHIQVGYVQLLAASGTAEYDFGKGKTGTRTYNNPAKFAVDWAPPDQTKGKKVYWPYYTDGTGDPIFTPKNAKDTTGELQIVDSPALVIPSQWDPLGGGDNGKAPLVKVTAKDTFTLNVAARTLDQPPDKADYFDEGDRQWIVNYNYKLDDKQKPDVSGTTVQIVGIADKERDKELANGFPAPKQITAIPVNVLPGFLYGAGSSLKLAGGKIWRTWIPSS